MGKGDAGKGKEESGNETPLELPEASPKGASTELSSESKTGTLLLHPSRPPRQLNTAAGTYSTGPHPDRNRHQSQSSETTGITSYDLHSEDTRQLSLVTTVIGSAANGERRPSELPVNSTQSPISLPSPTAAADVDAQCGK